MSEKNTGAVRAGCGRYDWSFSADSYLAQRLTITIETMLTLSAHTLDSMTAWASTLPYPWCERNLAMESAPKFLELNDIRAYVKRNNSELTI